jgi:hypothetical protein
MKYYKQNSIPLEEEFPGINETSFDQYGNYIQIDVFNEPYVLKNTVLKEGERIDDYQNEIFLKGFWAQTKKNLEGYEIQDSD